MEFLDATRWGGARVLPLAGDASFRRYYRLGRNGSSAVLMDAAPPQEDIGPYIAVATLLRGLGLSAPAVLAEDREQGFLLLEDFGDDTYTRLLACGAPLTRLAYQSALAWTLRINVSAVGFKFAKGIATGRPVVLFKAPTAKRGWEIQPVHSSCGS